MAFIGTTRDSLGRPQYPLAVTIQIGSFAVFMDLRSGLRNLAAEILELYEDYERRSEKALPDFSIAVRCLNGWRNSFRTQVQAYFNGRILLPPVPPDLGVPLLESGINWFIATQTTRFLLLHAAVVERGGKAVVLPGRSGVGKSTLCAALVARGWRLLSDEFAMVRPGDGLIQPFPRPLCLKNESIDMIARIMPDAHFGKRYEGTTKGTVAYIRASRAMIDKAHEPARPVAVVFPTYTAGASTQVKPLERAPTFMALVEQSANYATMLEVGFETLARLVEACDHYALSYDALEEAVSRIESLPAVCQGMRHVA